MTTMNEIPFLPFTPADALRPEAPGRPDQPRPTGSGAAADARLFETLLERLTARAAELEEKSKTLAAPEELPGAVDAARASLEDALALGAELLEAYRASRTNTGGASAGEVRP
jgi:hypothetical protein